MRHQLVTSDMMTRFMRGTFPDANELFMFKRQFTNQLAMLAFATYGFYLNKGAPHALRFLLKNGNMSPWELAPNFDGAGMLTQIDRIPFRLTPNLVNFVSPVGITGLFSSALVATAQTLQDPDFGVEDYLSAILRDELINWYANHEHPFQKSAVKNDVLHAKVKRNVLHIMKRLEPLSNNDFDVNNNPVDTLIKLSTSSTNLCMMPPTWHPWL